VVAGGLLSLRSTSATATARMARTTTPMTIGHAADPRRGGSRDSVTLCSPSNGDPPDTETSRRNHETR
jgi:hypothetical protein